MNASETETKFLRPMRPDQVAFARLIPCRWTLAREVGALHEAETGVALSGPTLSGRIRRLVERGAIEARYTGPTRACEVRRIVSVPRLEKL